MASEIHLSTLKTGRVFTSGNSLNPSRIWLILHGYGHLATYFIQKFAVLEDGKNLLVCPEGLHRFYLTGNSGRVGASWMTKEAREQDITDNLQWLTTVDEKILSQFPKAELVLFGFSQGAATAFRWLKIRSEPVNYFVVYASLIPPEVEITFLLNEKVSHKTFFVWGDSDEFISEIEKEEQRRLLSTTEKKVDFIEFTGAHVIDSTVLNELIRQMNTLTPFC